jgi:NADH dehydrogenase
LILVTGATGFVGGHVVHALRARGKDVRVLVRDPRKAGRLEAWGATLVEGDMTQPARLRAAVAGCDTVVHLVAVRQGREERFQRVMVDGTRELLTASQAGGAGRFIQMSALGTSEQTKDLVPYYRAKWETEQLVAASSIPHVIFRPSFVFGGDGGILPTFVKLARLAPVTPIIGSGRQQIQPIWVDDVAEYFARAVDLDAATGRTFELGGPDAVSWNDFWERLKRVRRSRRPSVHVPVRLMRPGALVTERLPGDIPLTNDLLTMLEHGDNVVSDPAAVETFAFPLVPLDEQLRRAV